ncbi:fungal-specific transcription factor domain-containing protein [Phascolomyces articulosus]|uniref:Fungal-specific transcription factor domain-containing protein n=1 Tax=Phascolomyces articulosus TaxID=60185 RepID=A0AAD5K7R8_9FUNG|nr:fungal-specific transcription factor domain-containing protein [Phascolomyces articulosus]
MKDSTSPTVPSLLPKQRISKFKVDKNFEAKKYRPNNNISNLNKRAISCDQCRQRKVRCELVFKNQCSQCRKAGIECKFQWKLSNKKVTTTAGGIMVPHTAPRKQNMEALKKQVRLLEQLLQEERKKNTWLSNSLMPQNTTTTTSSISLPPSAKDTILNSINYLDLPFNNDIRPSLLLSNNLYGYPHHHRRSVKDLIQDIPDLTPELTERLIVAYFHYIHPNSPIIDKRSFLLQYYFEYPHPMDEYLFYAMCAVGCQYLPRQGERPSRTVGRYLRKKILSIMNMAYKQSSIITVQVLLLLSVVTPHSDNEYEEGSSTNWLILGAAIRMAQDLGLHSDSCQNQQHLSENEIQIRRRIAYTIYVLDKVSSASTGRPFVVKDEEFDVELPLPYELAPSNEKDHPMNNITDLLVLLSSSTNAGSVATLPKLLQDTERDIQTKQPIYSGSFETIRLARMIGYVLRSFYTSKTNISNSSSTTPHSMDVNELDTKLMTWQLNPDTYFSAKDGKVYVGILYDSLLLLRFQPLILTTSTQKINKADNVNYVQVLDTSSIEYSTLNPYYVTHVSMIAQAATIFLQNCNHENGSIRIQARKELKRCADLYQRDDIVNRTKNASVINELVQQLSEVERIKEKTYAQKSASMDSDHTSPTLSNNSSDSSNYSMMKDQEDITVLTAYGHQQLFVPYNDTIFEQQQQILSESNSSITHIPSFESNFDHILTDSVL